jgi:catechol 2,3-dioxygenase-like lactoylglutathione lyase family enzyme
MVSLSNYRVGAAVAVSDLAAARRFYEGVLGLVVATDSGDNIAYACGGGTLMHVYTSPNAGTAKSTLAGWDVPDVDQMVKELTAQGVTFERYTEGPIITDEHGVAIFAGDAKVAYFKDPEGNILSIAHAPAADETSSSPLANADVATRLPAQDLERARAFYAEKLGLEPIEQRPGGLRYRCGNTYFALFESSGAASGTHTQMGWEVDDIDAVVEELRRRGVEFEEVDAPGLRTINGIADIDGNYPSKGVGERGAWFRDSEGNLLGIGQPLRNNTLWEAC